MSMKKSKKLVLVGDSALAEIAYEYFTYDSEFEVVGFSVEKAYLRREKLFGLPVVPFEDIETYYDPQEHYAFVAIAYRKMNRVRTRLYKAVKAKGYKLTSYVSSHAFVWRNVEIGENCFIFEDNVIQPFVKIGNNVILWSGNHIGHHSVIKDNCFLASHIVVSGFVEIGENCFIGVNSTIANNLKIAKNCLIGAGTIILRDTKEGEVYGSKMSETKPYNALEYFKVEPEDEVD